MAKKTSTTTVEFDKKEVDDMALEKAKEIAGQKAGTSTIDRNPDGGIVVTFTNGN